MAKILIVDDAAFMRKVIRDTLTKEATPISMKLWTDRMRLRSILKSSLTWC